MKHFIVVFMCLMCANIVFATPGIDINGITSLVQMDSVQAADFKKANSDTRIVQLASMLKTCNEQIQKLNEENAVYKSFEKDLMYLSDAADIFTKPMPDSTEVKPALRPLAHAIKKIKDYKDAIDGINAVLENAPEELRKNQEMTYKDFLKTDIVLGPKNNLIEKNNIIETLDKTIFTKEQLRYIEDLQEQYNNIIINNFL